MVVCFGVGGLHGLGRERLGPCVLVVLPLLPFPSQTHWPTTSKQACHPLPKNFLWTAPLVWPGAAS